MSIQEDSSFLYADDVLGVMLAGGLSRRFGGGDKCLEILDGVSLLERIAQRAAPQVGTLILNAVGDIGRFPDMGVRVAADVVLGALGPLAGVLTGMEWAVAHRPMTRWVATFATDAPFFPHDLVTRLKNAAEKAGADIAMATSEGRVHPTFALWSLDLRGDLRHALVDEGVRRVRTWSARHREILVPFHGAAANDELDPFFNINTPDDLIAARAKWRQRAKTL